MKVLQFNNLARFKSEVVQFISTREAGFSKEPFASLNLGLHVEDDAKVVLKNRRKLAKTLEIPLENWVLAQQTHSANIQIIAKEDRGKGAVSYQTALPDSDALVTNAKELCIMVLIADCVPLLLFDPKQKVIAAIHAGWRGTVQQITAKTVQKMQQEFGCRAKDIVAGIGPAIGPCHFELQKEVFSQFQQLVGKENKALSPRKKRLFVDLWELNKQQLLKEGFREGNIEILSKCTVCENQKFFSARKEKITGRFAAGIMLKK